MRIFPNKDVDNSAYTIDHLSYFGSGYIQTDPYNIGSGYGYGFSFGNGYGYGTIGGRGEGNGYLKYPEQLIQYWSSD